LSSSFYVILYIYGDEILKIHESAENYLETIFVLSREGNSVRSIDIVKELDYSKPSVSIAMKNLCSNGHISIDADGHITLTESGRKVAESMYEMDMLISGWLVSLGVDRKTAVDDACRIEHVISAQSFRVIKKHIEDWNEELGSR
jgi:Mn-dependent DtxR family transcriptional regulator